MAVTASGVGSNLDVNSIVSQLMTLEQRPLTLLNNKEASHQAKLSAYGVLRAALSTFQGTVSGLKSAASSPAFAATSSDSIIATASAAKNANPGSYSLDVLQLAQRQSIVTAGQASSSTAIGDGSATTLTFEFGTISGGTLADGVYSGATFTAAGAAAKTVTIDATNNTLTGIRDAINSAGIGVKASIVKDGSTAPYRLVIQAENGGAANSMRIGVSGNAAIASLMSYDAAGTQNMTQTLAGQDTEVMINGVTVKATSATISDAIEGVTFNLVKVGTATITVGQDNAAIRKSVDAFVKSYNELNSSLRSLTAYNEQTKVGGALLGDSAARSIQARLRSVLGATLGGTVEGEMRVLSQAGISFQRDGSLLLDSAKLDKALTENADGVLRMFSSSVKASDSLVRVVSSGSSRTGTYAVDLTTAGTQGRLIGAAAAGLTITQGVNDALNLNIDGISGSVTLTPGTYTAASLATMIEAAVNGAPAFQSAGSKVSVAEASGVLTITSQRYGSASSVSASGNAASDLFGGSPSATTGTDVAGSINGLPATATGQQLIGAAGSDVDGLTLEVSGTATGSRGTVTVSKSFTQALGELLDEFLSGTGPLTNRTDGINRSLQDITRQRETLSRRLDSIETRYRAQFTTLDGLISSLNATSTFLTQQLAKLNSSS